MPFSSINYSREDQDARMAIGAVDIVGRMRSRVGTSEDDCHLVEFSIRSEMILIIGRYRVGSMKIDSTGVIYDVVH